MSCWRYIYNTGLWFYINNTVELLVDNPDACLCAPFVPVTIVKAHVEMRFYRVESF